MQKVAIIGKDSYIGNAIDVHLKNLGMVVEQVEAQNGLWESFDFRGTDSVIMVAAIVHRRDITDIDVYDRVNTQLPIQVAQKAKEAGVKQFVFLSTMAVFGKGRSLTDYLVDESSQFAPSSIYAKSKYAAEMGLKELEDQSFAIAIVRPPSVYGKNCRGNLMDKYISIANKLPVIPMCHTNVPQGMLHVDNLSAAVGEIVRKQKSGAFHPQDKEPISSAQMLIILREANGHKAYYSKVLGKMAGVLRFAGPYKKLFGGIAYAEKLVELSQLETPMRTTEECLRTLMNK